MVTCLGAQCPDCKSAGRDFSEIQLEKVQRRFRLNPFSGCRFFVLLSLFLLPQLQVKSADTQAPSSPPGQDLAAFQLERGFHIELVASEPMITAPVAMAFDENGRLFVVEMRGRDTRGTSVGRVRMLDKMNEDGVFQNSTIYAENLTLPSAVACYAGGIFVAAGSEIVYLKDTKGDGLADARQVVLSGFGGTNTTDPDFLPNNFNWGPDNRIHASSGGTGGEIFARAGSGPPVDINGFDFSFDPRTLDVFPEAGPSESGLSFDSHGRKFVCDYVRPLLTPAYEERYEQRNPYFPKPPSMAVVADPLAAIFPYVPPQPAGTTNARRSNPLVTRRMTRARGCLVYRGLAFTTNYYDNVFVADSDAHLIHRIVLNQTGLTLVGHRAPNELTTEFLVSKDASFRPVQLINGPDGAIYIADLQDGSDRGRIYRVLPDHFKRPKMPQLGKVKTYELVSILAQGGGWHRDTAARLLYERKDPAAPALLRGTLARSRLASARALALSALAGAGALNDEDLFQGMRDPDEGVRARALVVSETRLRTADPSALFSQLGGMVSDGSPAVRQQLAFTLGQIQGLDAVPALARLVGRDLYQPAMQNAVLSSSAHLAGSLFVTLASDASFLSDAVGFGFLEQLGTMIGLSGHQDAVTQVTTFLAGGKLRTAQTYELLYDVGDGLHRTRSSLALVDTGGALRSVYSAALNLAADPNQPDWARTSATRLLGVSTLNVGSVADWLLLVCSPPTSPGLQSAAVDVLSRYTDPQVVGSFLRIWPILAPQARVHAISALLSRDVHVSKILDALQSRDLLPTDLSSSQRNFLRTHPVAEVRSRALALLGPVPMNRPAEMTRYRPALSMPGEPERGREVFRLRCSGCHVSTSTNQVTSFGPELLRARLYTKERLLTKILEPNLSIRPDYATQVVQSKEGQSLVGIITDQSGAGVTLKQIENRSIVWPELNIREIQPQVWSLMPEGQEVGLTTQDMADLLEFLVTRK
ncbi:MAG TPA: PVC-type heme-binding CxxCH protein [Verrucomicrobiae bacterium]|nr:PVC-type heme-binding CxxCH protein [Verrucomicrobiae bacterium]